MQQSIFVTHKYIYVLIFLNERPFKPTSNQHHHQAFLTKTCLSWVNLYALCLVEGTFLCLNVLMIKSHQPCQRDSRGDSQSACLVITTGLHCVCHAIPSIRHAIPYDITINRMKIKHKLSTFLYLTMTITSNIFTLLARRSTIQSLLKRIQFCVIRRYV